MKQGGYQVPALNRLIADVDVWAELDYSSKNRSATTNIEQLVEEAYLRTLSRYPDDEETAISVGFINESKTPAEGVESLLWALVNTKEFIITH